MSSGLGVAVRELRHVAQAWRAPRRSPADVRREALAGVNQMLAHARVRVPHYAALPPGPLGDLADLARFPVLTKRAVVEAGVEQFHDPTLAPRDYRTDVTSGTTGTRLEIRHDVAAYGYHGATVLRRFLLSGYRPWWRIAHIKPFPRPVRWFQRLGLFPREVVGAGQSEEVIAKHLLRIRPQLVMGYPVVLRGVLRVLDDADRKALGASLRMVMTDSELLTDEMAALLSEGFGVPIYDEYSAYEVLTVSTQCRHGSMHVDEDRVWMEVLDPDGQPVRDGEEGLVTITHFRERAMPLLRYQLGDVARLVPGRCPCGSSFRRMALTQGRVNDFIVLPGGRRVYSGVFLSLAMFTPGVAECMVRQDDRGAITVHLVPAEPGEQAYAAASAAFEQAFRDLVDDPVPLAFVRAENIDLTPGGKGRFVESSLGRDGA